MAYDMTSGELIFYIYARCKEAEYPFSIEQTKDKNGKEVLSISASALISEGGRKRIIIKPEIVKEKGREYDRVEFYLEPDIKGVDSEDVSCFLENMVNNDKIFDLGEPLYNEERREKINEWKRILKRVPNKEKMSCKIVNREINNENLRRTIWEYMFRLCLFYFYNSGKYAKK